MQIGYKLASEGYGPQEIIRQAVRAEQAGFDFVEMSDHFHPWLDVQGHSSFTWSVLGAIATKTSSLGLATGVTCPTVRYHPAIIAQAAASATMAAELGDGLFATEPKSSIVEHYRAAGGSGPRYAEVPLAWAGDEEQAVRAALETSR